MQTFDHFFVFRIERMDALIHICNAPLGDNFELGTNVTDESIFRIIRDVAPSLLDTMDLCKWRNENHHCFQFFRPILTDLLSRSTISILVTSTQKSMLMNLFSN